MSSLVQIIIAFCTGLIFAPLSSGFVYFLIFTVIWELGILVLAKYGYVTWDLNLRVWLLCVSISGFILGRLLIGHDDPLVPKNPNSGFMELVHRTYG